MIRPATQDDIDFVRSSPMEEAVKDYSKITPTGDMVALAENGNLWGVGGVIILREGMGEFWFILRKSY